MYNFYMNYISLFSSAGIGTFGLKELGYKCIATNEIMLERMNIQKFNNICDSPDRYIVDDIKKQETKDKIIKLANQEKEVDFIFATPPCQGISLLNLKKNGNDKYRNSLVVESLELIKKIKPNTFVLENVQHFLTTACLYRDNWTTIKEAILQELGSDYSIAFKTLNLKYIGGNSSRTRTIIIGVKNKFGKHFSPFQLFPKKVKNIPTLGKILTKMPSLKWGEICANDFYHAFRTYDERMLPWIENLKPNMSAFDNADESQRPHRIIDGKIVPNKNSTGDKYKRQDANDVAKCIMTRNDQLASQNTIHPYEPRVFSIRELMELMTIPKGFKFYDLSNGELNDLTLEEKYYIYKKNELNIRRTIGEAVPTFLFKKIAINFIKQKNKTQLNSVNEAKSFLAKNKINNFEELSSFAETLTSYSINLCFEEFNKKAYDEGMYFTNPLVVTKLLNDINFKGNKVLEPSVGIGSMLIPLIFAFPEKELIIDAFDINNDALKFLKKLIQDTNTKINLRNQDFLKMTLKSEKYDLVFGNPPFISIKKDELEKKYNNSLSYTVKNTFELFTLKSLSLSKNVVFVLPKYILYNTSYASFRNTLLNFGPAQFWDFKSMMFPNAKIETVVIHLNSKRNNTFITDGQEYNKNSLINDISSIWTIHPNDKLMKWNRTFSFVPLTSKRLIGINRNNIESGNIKLLTSKNLRDPDSEILYINSSNQDKNKTGILVPNMTPNIKAVKKDKNVLWDGSLALIEGVPETHKKQAIKTWNSKEFNSLISVLRSHAQRSINIDKEIIKHFGWVEK